MRVIADHARTTAFLIAEGVFPDRAGREYVLRRVMRRAIRHGHRLGIGEPFMHEMALEVVRLMGDAYPELGRRRELIASVSRAEEGRFRETIERGLKILDEEIDAVRGRGEAILGGPAAFKLYDTYGFPVDLTQVIAQERGLTLDEEGYARALEEQRARSADSKLNDETAVEAVWRDVAEVTKKKDPAGTKFVGYEREEVEAHVVAIVKDGAKFIRAMQGENPATLVTDLTPFYGESGGQVGDRGTIERRGAEPMQFEVSDTQKPVPGVYAHQGRIAKGAVAVGDVVHMVVDFMTGATPPTVATSSATHLLHWALRTVLGEQATQKGSLVSPDRLRFDFSQNRAMTPEEIARVEDLVNAKILTDAPVTTEILPIDEARKRGAVAIFEEKYGDVVRMLTMTSDSVELCGGTHARALGEIGSFKITSEQGLAAGVRRIEAVTGLGALAYVRSVEGALRDTARLVKAAPTEVAAKVDRSCSSARRALEERRSRRSSARLAMGGGGAQGSPGRQAGA